MAKGVQGLAEAYSLFDHAPDAARQQLAVELGIIGKEILAAQRADAPKDTGRLEGALSLAVLLDRLKVRVGLIAGGRDAGRSASGRLRRAVSGGPFYGRIVEFGRSAQTVTVTRRIKKRRVRGNGRNGTTRTVTYQTPKRRRRRSSSPNRGTFVGDPYRLRVKARSAHPYIAQPLLQEAADQHLGDFWAQVLANLGSA